MKAAARRFRRCLQPDDYDWTQPMTLEEYNCKHRAFKKGILLIMRRFIVVASALLILASVVIVKMGSVMFGRFVMLLAFTGVAAIWLPSYLAEKNLRRTCGLLCPTCHKPLVTKMTRQQSLIATGRCKYCGAQVLVER
jgi:DNA-directed RNA polymerase subunit RPC12/RpoP